MMMMMVVVVVVVMMCMLPVINMKGVQDVEGREEVSHDDLDSKFCMEFSFH